MDLGKFGKSQNYSMIDEFLLRYKEKVYSETFITYPYFLNYNNKQINM